MPAPLTQAASTLGASPSSSDEDHDHVPDRSFSTIADSSHTSASDKGDDESDAASEKGTGSKKTERIITPVPLPIPLSDESATAEGIVSLLQACLDGTLSPPNKEAEEYTVPLCWEEYHRLREIPSWPRLSESLRWDYCAHRETFTLRMPALTALHEYLAQGTVDLVFDAAKEAGAGLGSLETLVKRGSSSISVPGPEGAAIKPPNSNTAPDNSLGPKSETIPTFVLEVGFSNPRTSRDVKRLIKNTNGNVRAVLLLNVTYRTREERLKNPGIENYRLEIVLVKVVVEEAGWRPSAVHRHILSSDGGHDGALPLSLGDFYLDGLPATRLNVTHAQLWACLEDAVRAQIREDEENKPRPPLRGNLVGKRKLSDSEGEVDDRTEAGGGWKDRMRKRTKSSG